MGAELKIGSVVRLRNRIWRVDRVDDREFWATPFDGRDTRGWRFLRSLEEGDVMHDGDVASTERERITRIQDESFYGHEQVRLPQVEQALQQTYRTVGAPAEIQAFVLSALEQFRASALQQSDGTWKVGLGGTNFNDLGDELICTFDPKVDHLFPHLFLSMVVAYGRPFTENHGVGCIQRDYPRYPDFGDADMPDRHKRLLDIRHKFLAHSSAEGTRVEIIPPGIANPR